MSFSTLYLWWSDHYTVQGKFLAKRRRWRKLLHFSLYISYENLVLDHYDNFLISLSILITCLLDNVWILLGEVAYWSLLEVKGLMVANLHYHIHPFTGLCLVGFRCDGLGWRHFTWSIAFEMIMIGKTFKTLLSSIIFSLDIYWKTCSTLKSVLLIFYILNFLQFE